MNLTGMRSVLRHDLHDEDSANYRWSDSELDRSITRAVREFSLAVPLEQNALLATTAGSRELNVGTLIDRIVIEALEYPVDLDPRRYCEFSLRGDIIEFKDVLPDGSNCRVYYGKLHTLDAGGSTIPERYEDIVAGGAAGYALLELSAFSLNRVNVGGNAAASDIFAHSRDRLDRFQKDLARIHWKNRVRTTSLS